MSQGTKVCCNKWCMLSPWYVNDYSYARTYGSTNGTGFFYIRFQIKCKFRRRLIRIFGVVLPPGGQPQDYSTRQGNLLRLWPCYLGLSKMKDIFKTHIKMQN